ncbi:MAG TPA: sialate O-acetylesterase [Bacteroides mediterraneensis]|uniref:sialate O-acetylesterase n=1 Tax=Bacteroides mediterraneensis TaxID=1841856 RepID=UPI002636A990|nr:sialate O-acetylesterase [Bacteroides mediterraneensis]HJH64649.1 sialate O-acetylesterase [Bacteroides mediterraneensis]
MKNTNYFVLGLLALTLGIEVKAQIQLPSVFSDGMVLQQNSKVAVWGWGNPSETLMILSEWSPGDTVRAVVDNQGRWKAEVPTGCAGGPYTLEVKGWNDSWKVSDVMLGEVWLCSGQSNMEWSADMGIMNGEQEVKQAACPSVRIFHNPKQGADTPQTDCRTKWEVATPESMRKTSATAYFFARYLTEHLKVPVGILVSAWGGTPAEVWTPAEIVEKDKILSKNKLKDYPWWPIKPGVLYNQMIHPLVPYQIAGCIWYQGESNHENAPSYARLVSKMVESWRKDFRWDFPFYYVQIAPHTYGAKNNTPALLREQQELMLSLVKSTAMINISDLVENVKDIHPRNKRAIGERLACLAMDKVYGQFTNAYESPHLASAELQRGKVVVNLEGNFSFLRSTAPNITGLVLTDGKGDTLTVKAKIKGKQIVLPVRKQSTPPYQVSYCFDEATIGSLRTEAGLPVLPFCTKPIEK